MYMESKPQDIHSVILKDYFYVLLSLQYYSNYYLQIKNLRVLLCP